MVIEKSLIDMQGKGTINIELEGLSPQELDRCKEIIDTLFIKKVLFIKNGSATLHFDNDATLQEITYETRWRRNKPDTTIENYKSVKINLL